jgi:hypothetical protein
MKDKTLVKSVVFLMLTAAVTAGPVLSQENGSLNLEAYRWKNRLLLVFAPSMDDPGYLAFLDKVQVQREGVEDRDLVVFQILPDNRVLEGDKEFGEDVGSALRRKFFVKPETFTVVLVGKDGGVKLRRGEWVDLKEIFNLIDTMPMRQREMLERSHSGLEEPSLKAIFGNE